MPNFTLDDSVFEAAARQFPTPFYLYDARGIRETVRKLKAAFAWNPGFLEFYAVKALPNPHILSILLEEGCGLDCSSLTELMLAQRLNTPGENIMFSANAMPGEELAFARQLNARVNLDDLHDVATLAQCGGVPETVSLRVNPGLAIPLTNDIMGDGKDAKFGMTPAQLRPALEALQRHGAAGFGLHAMTQSNALDETYLSQNAGTLLKLGLELEQQTGMRLSYINLSGGLGIPYYPHQQPMDIARVGEHVRKVYEQALGRRKDVRVFCELGRFITGPHGFLVTRVIHRKSTWREYAGLDASASNLMRPAMYGAYHHIHIAGKREVPHDQVYDVTGPLCENNDKFAIQRDLPQVNIGDLLIIHDTGAHGHAMGYQYNGRLRGAEVLRGEYGSFRLIRRAETPEDYFSTLVN